jgi:glycosyltransferase involved in cell wall biosynthesis
MRILYFLQAISPLAGGGESLFYNLVKKMKKRKHEISIICYQTKKPEMEVQELESLGVDIYAIGPKIEGNGPALFTYKQHLGYIMNSLKVGYQLVKLNHVDIIHANTYTPILPATILGKLLNVPVVSTVHHVSLNHWKLWASQQGIPLGISIIGPIYERFVLSLPTTRFHAVSRTSKEDLLGVAPKATVNTIYNGIDIAEFDDLANRRRYEQFVLYIGRMVSTKNLGIVIHSFNKVIKSIPTARLIVVGDGPMRKEWEELAKTTGLGHSIIFKGHIDEREKKELLSRCTTLVLPSILEGFGRVIIEAFAMYKPVLASNIKSISEVIDDGINGFLISPYDVDKWAEKISFVLSSPNESIAMGLNGRRKVEQYFNLENITDGMEELYLEASSSKS